MNKERKEQKKEVFDSIRENLESIGRTEKVSDNEHIMFIQFQNREEVAVRIVYDI